VKYPVPKDTAATAHLRETAHGLGTLARVSLLTFAAELALDTLPDNPERAEGSRALDLAAQLAAGAQVNPTTLLDAMLCEDEGVWIYEQRAPAGPEANAWGAVIYALGYAAYQGSLRVGRRPASMIEGWASPDILDFCIDPYIELTDLDWTAMARGEAYVRQHGSKAADGWGEPLRVEDIRQAAFSEAR